MLYRESDGTLLAQWKDLSSPSSNLLVTAVFTSAEVDLSDPTPSGRSPFAVGCLTGPSTDPVPVYLSFNIFPMPDGHPVPANPPTLAGENAVVRSFIEFHAAEIRAYIWPPLNTEPPPPPTPVTLDQRSFFRLRTGVGLPADLNSNGIPTL